MFSRDELAYIARSLGGSNSIPSGVDGTSVRIKVEAELKKMDLRTVIPKPYDARPGEATA